MNIERIDSQKHPVIQILRELQTEKGREHHQSFHVEGTMVVSRALDYGTKVRFVVCTDKFESSEILPATERLGVDVYQVTEGLMGKVIPCKPPPVIVASVERRLYDPLVLPDKANSVLMLIDRCENPDNLGMLLRSLDAAGIDGVALTSDSVDPFNRLCVRASRGSVLSLRLCLVTNPEQWLAQTQEKGFHVTASSAHGSKSVWDIDFTSPSVIVVGNEHTGVRDTIREIADSFVRIPMAGKMESLNIAVAGAILAYEAARQRAVSGEQ